MNIYISGTYRMLYYIHEGVLFQLPYHLPGQVPLVLVSGLARTERDGVPALIKGRTREAAHNRAIRRTLESADKEGSR